MAAPKSSKAKSDEPTGASDVAADAAPPATEADPSPDMVPAEPKADAPQATPVDGAFAIVAAVHGTLEHDGASYKPGEPVKMSRESAAMLGDRVKPV